MEQLHEDKNFEKIIYAGKVIRGREFQGCTFKKCDFSASDFSYNKFHDCLFEGANLSMMKMNGVTLNNITFRNCKILGLNFSECHDFLFSVSFESCIVDYSSFMGKKMLKTKFIQTTLKETNFIQANLSGALFEGTDLAGAIFNGTDLSAANLVTAYNYSIDPELNQVKKAAFSMGGLPGLLEKHNIKIVE